MNQPIDAQTDQFMEVSHADGSTVRLCYRRSGDPTGPPLLMVMGLGAQLVAWPAEFVAGFGDRGFDVILFDNRDIGESDNHDDQGPTADEITAGFASGDIPALPYTLADMASDAAGLIRALDLGPTHVVGASMGGMIAQRVAIDHDDVVASLTSIMSNTGNPEFGAPTPEAMEAISTPAPADRQGAIDASVAAGKIWASPEHWDEASFRDRVEEAWNRGRSPESDGTMRQMGAILTGGSRDDELATLTCPTLVIHGDTDPLVTPTGGERTAALIDGAELLMLEGMGHDLPPIHWQAITEGVLSLARRAAEG